MKSYLHMRYRKVISIVLWMGIIGQICLATPLLVPSHEIYTREDALEMWRIADTILKPVYGPLAEQIVSEFQLAEKDGIGIDLGSGPGNLIIELCRRTKRMHWINADINPHFFPLFFKAAEEAGVGHRISVMFADAQAMPFKDNYANIIVSRGSFHLWEDKRLAFSEIYRALKPGGIAFICRGFSLNLPVEIAREVRAKQRENGKEPKYDLSETAADFREIMEDLGIKEYKIQTPKPPGSKGVNYGIWLEFRKPENPNNGNYK